MSVRSILAAALGAALLAPASAGAAVRLDSGPLRVEVGTDPFSLSFRDRADGDTLRTRSGALFSPDDSRARYGPLGYSVDLRQPLVNNAYLGYYAAAEAETLWFHATRVVSTGRSGRTLVVVAATNDPLGHRLEISISPAGEGGATVSSRIAPGSGPLAGRARVSGAAFDAAGGERYLGFGERSNAVDQTGNHVFSWAEEGPFSSGEGEALVRERAPDFTFPTGPTASNFPIPWLVSTRGLGFLIDQTQRSTFDLLNEVSESWHAETEASSFRFTVFAGPTPAQVVRRYSRYAGRQPRAAPWVFGPWFQPTLEKRKVDLAKRFRREDVPVTVAQTYTHYLPCGAQRGKEAAERKQVRDYHHLGYKITTYFNPHVCTSYQPVYDQAAERGWFVKDRSGRPYVLSNPFTADERVSEIDFTHPGARGFFQRLLDDALRNGYDGWMEDFGEYTPTDSVFHNGKDGLEMHNAYPVIYHGTSTAHTKKRRGEDLAAFIRSGFHGAQPHARVVWGGDPTEDWSCADGLCAAVHQALSMGLSGIAYWGSDIGGFHALVNARTDDELNIRWLQFGAVSGVMRTQANGLSFHRGREQRSQVWHPAVLPIWRRYTKLRTQLYPYLAAASREYQRTGLPITRHLSLVYPGDARAARRQTDFMFGPDLLAAPVLQPGARKRTLYLPRGTWVNFWRSTGYSKRNGGLRIRRAQVVRGGRTVTVAAPLAELPLFARAGALIPLLPTNVDTLADVGGSRGLVKLGNRRRRLTIVAFPRGRSSASLGESGRVSSIERRREWRLAFRDKRRRLYHVHASLGSLRRPFRPCSVTLRGRKLKQRAWRYRAKSGVVRIRFRLGKGTLAVRGCPRSRS